MLSTWPVSDFWICDLLANLLDHYLSANFWNVKKTLQFWKRRVFGILRRKLAPVLDQILDLSLWSSSQARCYHFDIFSTHDILNHLSPSQGYFLFSKINKLLGKNSNSNLSGNFVPTQMWQSWTRIISFVALSTLLNIQNNIAFFSGSGSDAASLSTTAKREGEDYVLNGSKVNLVWVTIFLQVVYY